jgi:hypothetical protein
MARVARIFGLVLVAVCFGRSSGAVDAQDVPIASPIAWASETQTPKPTNTSTPEPTPTVTPTQEPSATSTPAGIDAILIEVRSADGLVGPGGSVAYQFQVTNLAHSTLQFQLVAAVDHSGWTVAVFDEGSTAPLSQPISLDSGEVHFVSVIMVAPVEAVAGEQVTLSLTAVDAGT